MLPVRLILAAAAALFLGAAPATAQPVQAKTVSACGTPGNTPVVGSSYPLTMDETGVLCTNASGGGGGGASATAAVNGTVAVVAGTDKPVAIDLFSSTSVLVKDTTGTPIDWTAPVAVTQSGTWNVGLSTGANVIGSISNTAFGATQSGTWTVQPGNTVNTTAWLVTGAGNGPVAAGTAQTGSMLGGVVYNSTLPTLTTGQQVAQQSDASGNTRVLLTGDSSTPNDDIANASALGRMQRAGAAGQNSFLGVVQYQFDGSTWDRVRTIEGAYSASTGATATATAPASSTRLSTNTTANAIKTGAGSLERVCVGVPGTAANTISLYDALTVTGTAIAVIDTTTRGCLEYNIRFTTGLTAITATGTAADLVIGWR